MRLNYWKSGDKQRIYINHNYRRTLKAYFEPTTGGGWRLVIEDAGAPEGYQRAPNDTRPADLKAALMAEVGQTLGEDLDGLSWSELVAKVGQTKGRP